jgi:carboxylesterase type B
MPLMKFLTISTISIVICFSVLTVTVTVTATGKVTGNVSAADTASLTVSSSTYVTVSTSDGQLRGQTTNGTIIFRGIPYADTFGGNNRFMPPQPVRAWSGIRDALEFGAGCPQLHHNFDTPKNQSETCAYLNVWTPAVAGVNARLPVMFFMHGGGFAEGAGSIDLLYDSSNLANHSVVVVTINYRLISLGFVVTDSLTGNFGIMDQRQAMQWVQTNIHAFGGDPTRVTIFGESAGAMSAGIHLISPLSQGLFHRAIMESNPAAWKYRSLKEASDVGNAMFKLLDCAPTDIACAQSKSLAQILNATSVIENNILDWARENWGSFLDGLLPWTPTVDGTDQFPQQVLTAFENDQYHKGIPIIIGTNQNEGWTFVYAALDKKLAAWEAEAAVAIIYGLTGGYDILKRYEFPNNGADARPVLSKIVTDYLFRCSSRKLLSKVAADGTNAFDYRYNHILTDKSIFKDIGMSYCQDKVCHASELPFVFGPNHYWHSDWYMTPDELALSQSFRQYWTTFAKSPDGNPNSIMTPVQWPIYNNTAQMNIVLETPTISTESFNSWDNDLCAFWDKVGYLF